MFELNLVIDFTSISVNWRIVSYIVTTISLILAAFFKQKENEFWTGIFSAIAMACIIWIAADVMYEANKELQVPKW